MDFYQGIVTDYLRADRAMFVNTECCIQLNPGDNPDTSGPHWYCDAVAINLRNKAVFLCEITYSLTLADLTKRLGAWNEHWGALCQAMVRDLHVCSDWPVRPWVFIPEERLPLFERKLSRLFREEHGTDGMARPKVTSLESVVPWKYRSWNHVAE